MNILRRHEGAKLLFMEYAGKDVYMQNYYAHAAYHGIRNTSIAVARIFQDICEYFLVEPHLVQNILFIKYMYVCGCLCKDECNKRYTDAFL